MGGQMTIAELRRILDTVEEQEGCGPNTLISLSDTGSCFLEEPVVGVATQGTEPVILIQTAYATEVAHCYYRGDHVSNPSLRLAHATRPGHLLDTSPSAPYPASPSPSRSEEGLLVGA